MSLPLTDLGFDDEIDRAWSRFHSTLVSQLTAITGEQAVSYVRERSGSDTAPDVTVRRLHDGVLCAVVTVEPTTDAGALGGWSRTGRHHLTGLGSAQGPGELVEAIISVARTVWGITHPSFLRSADTVPALPTGSRAAAMADHPAGGIGRTVRRVVHQRLAGSVEVDHYQALELRYPNALVQLQLWEVERSALLWTTIRGVADATRLDAVREMMNAWPDLELVADGSVVDVELAVDLGERPARTMIAALDRWHTFMQEGYPAVVAALVRPGDDHDGEVTPALRAVLRRHRDGERVTAEEIARLIVTGRDALLASLDVCRRQSVSWMNWADGRHCVGDSDGTRSAHVEAQVWDAAYATVSTALRTSVSPTT